MAEQNIPATVLPLVGGGRGSPIYNDITHDRGDFVDSEDECDIEAVTEDPGLYPRGLFYPICIGDVIVGRYRIDHKLGHGSFSTVWMAHDMVSKADVALKIMMLGEAAEREYRMQEEIVRNVPDTSHLIIFNDTFLLPSPHGCHRVLVLPLQALNLRDYPLRRRPAAARMSSALQLLQALQCLHGGKIIHGDLNSANIMYSLRPLGDCDITTKYEYLGRPQKMRLFTEQWKEGELVMPMKPRESLVGDMVLLGDFGLAHTLGSSGAQKLQSPAMYCAPERAHDTDPSFTSDMWSYMCLFFELYTTARLFPGPGHRATLTSMVNTLGPLPISWKGYYRGSGRCDDTWYDQDRRPRPMMGLKANLIRLCPDVDETELELVISILRRGLSYLPEHRPTAAQLLGDSSFRNLMAIYSL